MSGNGRIHSGYRYYFRQTIGPVRVYSKIFLILCILQALAAGPVFSTERAVRVFHLQHADASTAAEKIRPILSPDGALSVHRSSNSLIVNDYPHVVNEVERIVRSIDSLPEIIEIRAVGVFEREFRELGIPVRWSAAGGGWGLGLIKGADQADVRVSIARLVDRVRVRGGILSSVQVSPGESAAVWVQKRHRDPALLRRYLVRQNYLHAVSPFEETGTGLSLSPEHGRGGGFRLRIVPRVAYRAGEQQAFLDIAEASTVLKAPQNRWFLLSGGAATGRDVISILFPSSTTGQQRSGANLLMKVRKVR